MISKSQREALTVLQELCELSEDIRLGQLMAHLGFMGEIASGRTLWDIEDDELLPVLYQHRAELKARMADSSPCETLAGNPNGSTLHSARLPSDQANLRT
jgi:hypothetical protein